MLYGDISQCRHSITAVIRPAQGMTRRGGTGQSEAWLMHFVEQYEKLNSVRTPSPPRDKRFHQFDDQLAVPVEVGLMPNQVFEPIAGDVV